MGRPREHDEKTRLALLAAAEEQIAAGGTRAVSVRSVAASANTTTRAVYTLFSSKEGLLQALAVRAFELLGEYVDGAPATADPVHDLLTAGTVGFRRFAVEHPDLFRLVLGTSFTDFRLGPDAAAAGAAAYTKLIARVDRAQQAGRLRRLDTNLVALQLHATAQGMATLELCGMIDGSVADRLWNEMFTTLVAGWDLSAATEARGC